MADEEVVAITGLCPRCNVPRTTKDFEELEFYQEDGEGRLYKMRIGVCWFCGATILEEPVQKKTL